MPPIPILSRKPPPPPPFMLQVGTRGKIVCIAFGEFVVELDRDAAIRFAQAVLAGAAVEQVLLQDKPGEPNVKTTASITKKATEP